MAMRSTVPRATGAWAAQGGGGDAALRRRLHDPHFGHRPHGLHDLGLAAAVRFAGARRQGDERHRAGFHGAERLVGLAGVFVGADDDDRHRRPGHHLDGRLEAVHAGHVGVHEHHVGLEHRDQPQCLTAAGRLADDGDVALRPQQPAQAAANLGTVVYEKDTDHAGAA